MQPSSGEEVPTPAFYTAAEAARILRLDESTIYRHLRAGTFPALKIGGRYVVPGAVIERLIEDVLVTGRCVDLSTWTERWRGSHEPSGSSAVNEQSAGNGSLRPL